MDKKKDKAWASAVREARNEAGLTVEVLAGKVGVSMSGVSNWEQGRSISPDVHVRLVKALPALKNFPAPIGKKSNKVGSKRTVANAKVKKTKKTAGVRVKSAPKRKRVKVQHIKHVPITLVPIVIAMQKDRKALSRFQGLIEIAVSSNVTLPELSELLASDAS